MKEIIAGIRPLADPIYGDCKYGRRAGRCLTWEGDPWFEIGESYFSAAYIHGGLSSVEEIFEGPDAAKLLSDLSINDVYNWKPGRCKHLVALTDDGLIANHQLFYKDSNNRFRATAGCIYPYHKALKSGNYKCKNTVRPLFIFQIAGPLSLTILEKVSQTSLRDVQFLDFKPVRFPEIDAGLEIFRIGMSGTLAYEIHGDLEYGPAVYDLIYQAGKPMGMKRIGWKDYAINHTFGGFPQITVNFQVALYRDPEFRADAPLALECRGSVDPGNLRARFRTPVECRWEWMAKFNHEFVGRAALEEEIAHPKRRVVSLEFNSEDLADVYKSQFTDDPYEYMNMPCADVKGAGGHQDYVVDGEGNEIGYSANPTYSSHYRTMVAHAIIDIGRIEEGKEVYVKWGEYGKKIKLLRATIKQFPYIHDVMDNRDYNLSTVPSGLEL